MNVQSALEERVTNERATESGRGPAVLSAVDGLLSVVEKTAWDLRAVFDGAHHQARQIARDVSADWQQLEDDVGVLRRELGAWPERTTRAARVGLTLARLAAGYRLHRTHRAFLSEEAGERERVALHVRSARLFAETSAREGAGLLKAAQLLSTRPDLLPEAWIEACAPLQDDAPRVEFELVRERIEDRMGRPLDACFAAFDPEPVAAASIGQVHRATTHAGEDVAVKVTRPDIHARLSLDLDLLEIFLQSLSSQFPPADYETITREVREMLLAEVDYPAEGHTMARVRAFFAGQPDVIVPEVDPALTTHDVLVAEFVEGRKITRALDELAAARAEGDEAAARRLDALLGRLLEVTVRQILVAGVFQCDPHPGNFLVTDRDELVLLDFGCTRELEPDTRRRYLDLVAAFVGGDLDTLASRLHELGFRTRSGDPETLLRFAELLLAEFRERSAGRGPLDPQEMLAQANEALEQLRADPVVRIPGEFVMLGRVLLALGGLFQHYGPRIDYAAPVLRAWRDSQVEGSQGV